MPSRLNQVAAELPVVIADAVNDAAERIAAQATASAPVRTGRLKQSIDSRPVRPTASARGDAGFRSDVVAEWYWFLVEFGHSAGKGPEGATGPAAPHPFMIPAAEAERPRFIADVAKALRDL